MDVRSCELLLTEIKCNQGKTYVLLREEYSLVLVKNVIHDRSALVAPACSGAVIGDICPYPIKEPVKSVQVFPF